MLTHCDACHKIYESSTGVFPSDFRGNGVGFFCQECAPDVEARLALICTQHGGYQVDGVTKASPRGTPSIKSYAKLVHLTKDKLPSAYKFDFWRVSQFLRIWEIPFTETGTGKFVVRAKAVQEHFSKIDGYHGNPVRDLLSNMRRGISDIDFASNFPSEDEVEIVASYMF